MFILLFLLFAPTNAHAIYCFITQSTGINFGAYDVFNSTPTDSTGSFSYFCFFVGGASVRLSLSRGGAASYTPRRMQNGGFTLQYNLYLDASRTIIWGDGSGGSSYFQTVPPNFRTETVTIYGRIPPGQDIPAGNYHDTIVATLQW
ncbi:MAG: spore coat protein U domain-containing protein [Deltaproteobacteria bacterium]|nr:spore coat protein U domain-containing protein [Deltaproteobacteria bacterium]